MPMQITRQADYAVRAILHLARVGRTERVATAAIAEREKIPTSFLAKIISQLSIAGLIETSRGARGGVTLARDPGGITLLEVIESIDGPILLNQCSGEGGVCPLEDACPVREVWCDAQDELIHRLKRTTFAELLERHKVLS
jgi:Rrf2 family protein